MTVKVEDLCINVKYRIKFNFKMTFHIPHRSSEIDINLNCIARCWLVPTVLLLLISTVISTTRSIYHALMSLVHV